MELKQAAMQAAEYAGIKPNDMVRFIVDYGNSIDPIEPCAAVMTFCERFAELIKAANAELRGAKPIGEASLSNDVLGDAVPPAPTFETGETK